MPRYSVFFQRLIPYSLEFKSDDEHMIGRLYFLLYVDGDFKGGFASDVKQSVGGQFEDIEACPPSGYDGPLDYHGLSEAARKYILDLVGPQATLLRFREGATNIKITGAGSLINELKYTWLFDPMEGKREPVPL